MYQLRRGGSRSFDPRDVRALWKPEIELDDDSRITIEPRARDWYAVIDELDENVVLLEVAPWPELDRAGRLRFGDVAEYGYDDRKAFQKVIDHCRERQRQKAPRRNLRIGDAFWIRGPRWPADRLLRMRTIVDVSLPARVQAKIAQYGAITPAATPRDRRRLGTGASPAPPSMPRQYRDPGTIAQPEI